MSTEAPAINLTISRRRWLSTLVGAAAGTTVASTGHAFGQAGAFHPRLLTTAKGAGLSATRQSALSRWAWELVRRTSAPGRLLAASIAADGSELLSEPFCVWAGDQEVGPLLASEKRTLRQFFQLGGVLFVDDNEPERGVFGQSVRRELHQVLPEVPVVVLPTDHVVYKSYYLVDRPIGRVTGPPQLEAMIRGRETQVIFSSHDLLGALARDEGSGWTLDMQSPDPEARQKAIRLAVNLAMYVLCSDYKDDQVHAEELMRRRGRLR